MYWALSALNIDSMEKVQMMVKKAVLLPSTSSTLLRAEGAEENRPR